MLKNSHDRILRREPKEQYLSTVPKSCPIRKYTWIKHLWFIEKKKKKTFYMSTGTRNENSSIFTKENMMK